jgi:hypothetical protein
MTTDNFCFYLQNRLAKPVKQEANGTVILPPLVFSGLTIQFSCLLNSFNLKLDLK